MSEYQFWGDENVNEDEITQYPKIPKGERYLKVINQSEAKPSKNGDKCILLDIEDTQTSIKIKHWLYILPKGNAGHGFTKLILKILEGKKVDGNIQLFPEKWVGKIFKGEIVYAPSQKDPEKEFGELVIYSLKSLTENEDVPIKEVVDEEIPF